MKTTTLTVKIEGGVEQALEELDRKFNEKFGRLKKEDIFSVTDVLYASLDLVMNDHDLPVITRVVVHG